jgi:hypothetical protein
MIINIFIVRCPEVAVGSWGVPLLLVDAVLFWKSGSSFLLLIRGITIAASFSFVFCSDTVLHHLLCRIESVVVPIENLPAMNCRQPALAQMAGTSSFPKIVNNT